ncbi:hypothetical protein ACIQ62_22295 [Streptomyces sp. NPDC096319]|uniref:hypothetical protein n=1 Tax=Streptomyces sp. NPDC096319 TaxID=3366084 RepID=UPI0037FF5561
MPAELAERIVSEAAKFLRTASLFPTARIAPTKEFDKGWHALIQHTHTYAVLCNKLGRFVHHDRSAPALPAATRTSSLEPWP